MLDHAFLAAVETLRRTFDDAMLDRRASEERFGVDLLAGDLTWESSYALPGEGDPPRVRADVTLDWPTWSQTAYRSWMLDGELDEPPELGIEVVLRIQRLAEAPELSIVRTVLGEDGPELGDERLRLVAPMVEQTWDEDFATPAWAIELAYDATFELTEVMLGDLTTMAPAFSGFGAWVASVLVRLGDLRLAFTPPDSPGA